MRLFVRGLAAASISFLLLGSSASAQSLTKAFFKATHPALSAASFEAKWRASLVSPVMFIRSYPAAFHRALALARAPAPLGKETLCVGDAHPGNFGFLAVDGKTRYAYNDLDDSGLCPASYDVLRYFTALHMFFDDAGLVADIVERFVDVVKDRGRASGVKKSFLPTWDKVREKGLAELVRGGRLAGEELGAASVADKTAIASLFARDPRLRPWRVLDVAAVARDMGGSGGLRRYWVLATTGRATTVLELKQAVTPGVEWGVASKKLPFASRLETLKPAFWGSAARGDYFYVALGRAWFLVRDRFTKKSLKVEELGKGDRKDVLQAQASYLGALHARAFADVKKDDLRAFLLTHSAAQAKLWLAAYRAAKK